MLSARNGFCTTADRIARMADWVPEWLPRSFVGAAMAMIYIIVAIAAVYSDRHPRGGGWITLNGMATYLITIPVSMPLELLGHRPDYKRNLDMTLAIVVCAVMVYGIGAAIGFAATFLVGATSVLE